MRRRNEVLVGIMLTVAVAVGILGTIWLVRGGFSSGYPLYARFAWGANVKQGQPVRLAGVQIGYVGDVELDPRGSIVVTMAINDGYSVPRNASAIVQPVGFFGDQEIALLPKSPSDVYYAEGDTVPAAPPKPGIDALTARADTISARLDDVARSVQVELVQAGGIRDLRATIGSTNELIRQLNLIAAEQSRQLTMTMGRVRSTVGALDSAAIDSTVRNLQATSANVAGLTATLGETTTRLNAVLAAVDSGGGTTSRLLRDPGLYEDMRRLVTRLDSLTLDFKKNPRRYINLEIF